MEKLAHFIWLPDQPIRPEGLREVLRGTVLRRTLEPANRWVLFRRTFDLAAVPRAASWALTADGRYRAWLNGSVIGSGPVRSSPHFKRVDRHDVLTALRPGRNVCAVLVHTPGVDLAWYEGARGAWQPVFGDGGLYSVLELKHAAGSVRIVSDDEWRVQESDAWRRNVPRAGWGQDFVEDIDGRRLDPGWTAVDHEDHHWPRARALVWTGGRDEEAIGWGRVEAFPTLIQHHIPPPFEQRRPASRLVWAQAIIPRPTLEVDQRLYAENAEPGVLPRIEHVDGGVIAGGATLVHTTATHDTALLFAFDPYHAGRPFLELEACGGEIVEFAAAEALPGEYDAEVPLTTPLRREPHLGCAHIVRYTARPGRQTVEKFELTAVRALQITVRNAPHGLGLRAVASMASHYPAKPEGEFECSDAFLTRLWHAGRYTTLQCMHDAWIDCPGRERRQWIGDAVVGLDIAAAAFGPSALPLSLQALNHAAESQRPDGLVQMFAPGDHHGDGTVIPDFSLHWLIALRRYLAMSGDLGSIEALFPAALRALAWFERLAAPDGLLVDVPHWHFIEWAHVDRRGASAPINALYCAALHSIATLARELGYERAARRCESQRARVRDALNTMHWDPHRGVYVDSVDPPSALRRPRVSQHANGLMILHGLAPRERWPSMLAAITDESRLKLTAAPPIVTRAPEFCEERDVVRANTFFSHFVCDALARAGRLDASLAHLRAFYGPMLATGTATLWESFEPTASLCHAFSATPVYQLSRHVLGVEPLENAFALVRVAPVPADLEWARGIVPSARGPVRVEWTRSGDRLAATVGAPADCRVVFDRDDGYHLLDSRSDGTSTRVVWERVR